MFVLEIKRTDRKYRFIFIKEDFTDETFLDCLLVGFFAFIKFHLSLHVNPTKTQHIPGTSSFLMFVEARGLF